MGKSSAIFWIIGLVAVAGLVYWKRCEIPFVKNYLCGGGWTPGYTQGLSPTTQVPLPGGGMGTSILPPPAGIPDNLNPDAS